MKLTATNLLLPLLLLLSWLVGGAVEAQTPTSDYSFWLVPSVPDCTAGDEVTIDLYLQILPTTPVSTPLEGFTVGVCHNTDILALLPSSVVMGNWISSLQPCTAPDFLQVLEWGGTTGSAGYTIGTLFSFTGGCTLPVGCHHIATAEYSCAIDAPLDSSAISTCNTLGSPTVNTVVILGGDEYTPLSEFISGSLTVECNYPDPGQMELNWPPLDAADIFDSIEILCDGVVVATLPGTATSYIHFCDPTTTNCCIVRGNLCGVPVESEPCCCENIGGTCGTENVEIVCGGDRGADFTLSFDVINNSGYPVTHLLFPEVVGGVEISPNLMPLPTSLPDTETVTGIQLTLLGGNPGETLCIPFGLLTQGAAGLFEVCNTTLCVTIPYCGCLEISQEFFSMDLEGNTIYEFTVTNFSSELPEVAEHLFMHVTGQSAISITDELQDLDGLADTQSISLSTTILGNLAGVDEVCFQITIHDDSLNECCGIVHCVDFLPLQPPPEFRRGDANSDGSFDIADVVSILDYLFQGQSMGCLVALDSNDDEALDIADSIYSLDALFGGGPSPWPPYQECGIDETSGSLGCNSFPACGENDSDPQGD